MKSPKQNIKNLFSVKLKNNHQIIERSNIMNYKSKMLNLNQKIKNCLNK